MGWDAQGKLPCGYRLTHGSSVSAPWQIGVGRLLRRMRAKLGVPKAITATAHKLARIIFHLVTTCQEFDDSHFAADQLRFQTISWIPGYGSDSSRLADSRKFVVAANLASESLASL
jgi:hypothetical protein